jgi:hypothetical protein
MNTINRFIKKPSFFSGIARIFDFTGRIPIYDMCYNPEQADAEALASDWAAVGGDLRYAMNQVLKESPVHVKK